MHQMIRSGKVHLVGAGPGDPGLITLKGLDALRSADVVIFDRLAPAELLDKASDHAELVDCGKSRGAQALPQSEINDLMIHAARSGKRVCRLKGGDPFVFGRGGEEAMALSEAGIDWELAPGVSSAIAAPAYAGIPVTHRGISSGVAIVTGSPGPGTIGNTLDWAAIAAFSGTVVVLMAASQLSEIADTLIKHGRSADTPAAAIENGSRSDQKTVTADLKSIAEAARRSDLAPPVTLIIGDVAALRSQLQWFDALPLFGKRILVTRARSQSSRLANRLRELGAVAIECPVIKSAALEDTQELDECLLSLHSYDLVAFASPNGVANVWSRLDSLGLDARAFSSALIAAVGPATVSALSARGLRADIVPATFSADGLVKALAEIPNKPINALVFRSQIGGERIADGLRSLGAAVREATAYRTLIEDGSQSIARSAYSAGIDATTFTSSSTVKNMAKLLRGDTWAIGQGAVICIGPATAATAREYGIRVDAIADEQSINGMICEIVRLFKASGPVETADPNEHHRHVDGS